jgi:hypothetical protein
VGGPFKPRFRAIESPSLGHSENPLKMCPRSVGRYRKQQCHESVGGNNAPQNNKNHNNRLTGPDFWASTQTSVPGRCGDSSV